MDFLIALLTLVVGLLAGVLVGLRVAGRRTTQATELSAARQSQEQAVIRDGLDRLSDQLRDLDHTRAGWQGQLAQQVADMRLVADGLARETRSLSTALRRPEVRGRWGELHLRRTVELAGMVDHCDFAEQVHLATDRADGTRGAQRPDLVVHLAGGKSVVVDAKAPLDAYLDALAAPAEEQEEPLRRHARQLRGHVDALAGKAYWRALGSAGGGGLAGAPEFVVLFVPAESCLSAALGADPTLIEYAAARHVVLASPTTLIALLRTVAHGWTTERLAESTREIHQLGRELHGRLGTLGGHLDKVGRSLGAAVDAYNRAIGSLESRVLVTARQFEGAGVTSGAGSAETRLDPPSPVTTAPRPLSAAELLEAVAEPKPDLPDAAAASPPHQDRSAG